MAAKARELIAAKDPFESLNDGASMDQVAEIIANGVADGDGVDAIGRALGDLISDPQAAFMVADTEVADATVACSMDAYTAAGIETYEWMAEDNACDDCLEQEGETHDVGSDPQIPLHPACRCSPIPIVAGS